MGTETAFLLGFMFTEARRRRRTFFQVLDE